MGDLRASAASNVKSAPPTFRLRLRLLTPIELEQERQRGLGSSTPHFGGKEYRILWGTESVGADFFSSAPADVRSKVKGPAVQVPLAYYGTVRTDGRVGTEHPDGTVSQDILDVRNGEQVLELGEYQSEPRKGLKPEEWAVDQRASKHHFHPLVRIPLQRFDPPPVPKDAMQVELWWRLWNLGQIGSGKHTPTYPNSATDSAYFGPGGANSTFSAANQIAKAQWNLVRDRLSKSGAHPGTGDDVLLQDLFLYHDGSRSSR